MGVAALVVIRTVNDYDSGAVAHARGKVIVDIHRLPDGREVVNVIPSDKVKESAP